MRKFVLFAVIIILLASMVTTVYGAPPPDGPPGLERAIEVQEAHTDALLSIPAVVGTAVGLGDDGLAAVKIYTERAGVAGLPKKLDGVPVDVIVTGRFRARYDPKDKQGRPVPIGVSTGHPDITAGTIGARVIDIDGNVYALSNNHVYANSNEASIGDSALQPGTYDGGVDPQDKIGELYDFEPIKFDGSNNIMDAAIAKSSTDNLSNATLPDGYGVPSADLASAYVGQPVQKYGRTTGLTYGEVSEINVTVTVCYESRGPFRCVKSAIFVNQIAVTPGTFSDGGDSGSLIVTDDTNKNPVGLLFAGSTTRTIANPISEVLTRFNVTIDSEPADAPPSVSIASPAEGSTVSGTETVQISAIDEEDAAGMLIVEWNVDGGSWMSATYNSVSELYEADWNTTAVADGGHTVNARATDSGSNISTDSNSVLVDNVDDPPAASIVNPANGSTVSGLVTIQVDSSDDRDASEALSVDVSIDSGLWQEATYDSVSGYFELDWDTTSSLDGSHTIDARSADSALQTTDADQVTVTVNNSLSTIHVGDLDASKNIKGRSGNWEVLVTVAVHDEAHQPVAGATVEGTWSGDISGYVSGMTGDDGAITFTTGNMNGGSSVTFTVGNVTHSTLNYEYEAADNHDPDGDSDGTTITESK